MTTALEKTNGTQTVMPRVEENTRAISAFSSESNFAAAQRMAKAIGCSSIVPKAYQGPDNMPNVLIAMELAARIGASPLAVMQNLHIIQGRPSWSATFLIACVNQSGRFTPLRFRWEGKPGTDDWGCRAYAKEKETGEECIGALITIKLAKAEGWFSKPGSKWQTIPEQMMQYRSASFWSRVYAPELSLGMLTSDEASEVATAQVVEQKPVAELNAVILGTQAEPKPETATPNNETFAEDVQDASALRPPTPVNDELALQLNDAIDDCSTAKGLQKIQAEVEANRAELGPTNVDGLMLKIQAKTKVIK